MVKTTKALKISILSAVITAFVLLAIKFIFSWTGIITATIVTFLVGFIGMKWGDITK